MERCRFGGPFLVAGERPNGTRIHLFADFSGGFGTGDRALVPNGARSGCQMVGHPLYTGQMIPPVASAAGCEARL